MGARHKLNQIYVQIALIIAAIIGATLESWLVFFGTLAALLTMSVHSGEIRKDPPPRNRRRR